MNTNLVAFEFLRLGALLYGFELMAREDVILVFLIFSSYSITASVIVYLLLRFFSYLESTVMVLRAVIKDVALENSKTRLVSSRC